MRFTKGKIGDCCVVGDGAHGSLKRQSHGVLYLTSRNLKDGKLDLSKVDYIDEATFAKYFRENSKALTLPKADDVIFGIIGSIGEAYRVRPSDRFGMSSSIAILRPNREEIDSDYLFQWITSHTFQQALYAIKGGVAQGYVSLEMIRSLPLNYPSLTEQRKIAAILSDYDDLIENNTRRIQILEEIARRIYEEWFVRFRFPRHENVRMIESELGLSPDDWEVSTVADAFNILGGSTPSTAVDEYWHDGSINWYAPTDLTRSGRVFIEESADKITPLGLAKSSARMFPAFSVMMTSRATLGVIAINTTEACTNQGFITCIPSERFPLYILFHWLKQNVELFISLATGATFKEITKGNFKQIKLLVPPVILANKYQSLVEPIMQELLNLQRKNANLRRTRDLLLPKLISGEIDVSNFPESASD